MTGASELCARLEPAEKLDLLTGPAGFWEGLLDLLERGPVEPFRTAGRLGLDGLHIGDGPRGVGSGIATCFPVAIARAATFDPVLEERVGEAIGQQLRFSEILRRRAGAEVPARDEHRALAREVATAAIVLLKNDVVSGDAVLPLDAAGVRRVAVLGRLAEGENTGDRGSRVCGRPMW